MTQMNHGAKPTYVDPGVPVFPLSVDLYHELIRDGRLTNEDPVELIEGVLVFHMPKNPPHEFVIKEVEEAVERLLPAGWIYRTESSLTLNDGEPEPDGLIVRGTRRDYIGRHPGAGDVAVVIEVSDSTLARDRGMKQRSYARAGIATYWIVNLAARTIEVYSRPQAADEPPAYTHRQDYPETDAVPVTIDGITVGTLRVRDVLP